MILELFKKTKSLTSDFPEMAGRTNNEIIEEIHDTFYTEVDKLLASAKVENSLDTDKQALIDKCERLRALGFTNTKEVNEAKVEIARLEGLKRENEVKRTLIEAINYFSIKYPNYKFITESSVKNICAKYNLVYGPVDRYTGTVPDKNLKHIEDFKVLEEDECYIEEDLYYSPISGDFQSMRKHYKTFETWREEKERKVSYDSINFHIH